MASAEPQLIPLDEGVGKMKAALDGRSDPSLVIMGRTGTRGGGPSASTFDDCLGARKSLRGDRRRCAVLYRADDAPGSSRRSAAATTLPIVLGNTQGELDDVAFLASQRVKIALQGHAPFAAATQAVYETLEGVARGCVAEKPERTGIVRACPARDARAGYEGARGRHFSD